MVKFTFCHERPGARTRAAPADIDSAARDGHKPALLASGFGPRRELTTDDAWTAVEIARSNLGRGRAASA